MCVRTLGFLVNHCAKPGTDERHIHSDRNQLHRDVRTVVWLCERRHECSRVPHQCVSPPLPRYYDSTDPTRPTENWGFKWENIIVLTDDRAERLPTRDNILKAIEWLVGGAKANDSLFFHCARAIYIPHHTLLMSF